MPRSVSALALLTYVTLLAGCGGDDGNDGEVASGGPDGADAGGQQARAFAILRGQDTLLIERFTLSADRVSGVMLHPGGASIEYESVHGSDERSMRITQRPPDAQAAAPIVWNFTVRGDSAWFQTMQGDSSIRMGDAVPPGTLPHMSPSVGMMALTALTARSIVGDSGQASILAASVMQPPVVVTPLVRWRADTAWVTGGDTNQFKLIYSNGQLVSAENAPQQLRAVQVSVDATPSPASQTPTSGTQPPASQSAPQP